MDIATILGIISGIGLIIISIMINSGLDLFINFPSMMIVAGGTIAATLISYPLKEFLMVMGLFVRVFRYKSADPNELLAQLIDVSNASKDRGVLSIEEKLPDIKDPFFSRGLALVIEGTQPNEIARRMRNEISIQQKKHKVGWEIFSSMGKYSPAFGMIGTLIGLIQMLANLSDPDSIGPRMAVALITTFYGSLLANLAFLPMSAKLKRRSAEETSNMNLILEGVLSIRNNESARIMEEKLEVYLTGVKKKELGDLEEQEKEVEES